LPCTVRFGSGKAGSLARGEDAAGFELGGRFAWLVIGGLAGCHSVAVAAADWKLQVGPGSETLPVYPGARQLHTVLFPFVDAEYEERLYTSGDDLLGVYGYKTENTQLGGAVEYDLTARRVSLLSANTLRVPVSLTCA